jgi:copper oxidase (laccase) domain-containing protein
MEQKSNHITSLAIQGRQHFCQIGWSKMTDGPMNLIGREFPIPEGAIVPAEAGDKERIANRKQFLKKYSLQTNHCAVPKLSHGTKVMYAAGPNAFLEDLPADGLLSDHRGLVLTTSFADCPPVVIFDEEQPHLVVLHAGLAGHSRRDSGGGGKYAAVALWKPLYRFKSVYRSFHTQMLLRGRAGRGHAGRRQGHYGKLKIDLPDIIAERLFERAGVKPIITPGCSKCAVDSKSQKPLYYSYRRDHKVDPTDNQMLFAILR